MVVVMMAAMASPGSATVHILFRVTVEYIFAGRTAEVVGLALVFTVGCSCDVINGVAHNRADYFMVHDVLQF